MRFAVNEFKGMIPILGPRRLPEGYALLASDADLKGSDLRVFNKAIKKGNVQNNSLTQLSSFVINSNQMFVWPNDVCAVWGPIIQEEDIQSKIYIDSGWLGYPIYTTIAMGVPNPAGTFYGYPTVYRKLGVPAPAAAPIVTPDANKSGAITEAREESATLEDGVTIVDGGVYILCALEHGLKDGDRTVLSGFDWPLLNAEFIISTLDPIRADAKMAFFIRGMTWDYLLGASPSTAESVPAGTPPVSGTNYWPTPGDGVWGQVFTDANLEDRYYIYTYVTDQGEEGPPSPPSLMITIGPNTGVTVTFPGAVVVEGVIVAKVRLYRTIPTSKGSGDYYFVDEVVVSTATYYDTKDVIQLAEKVPSLEWDMPPEGLIGFVSLPNGVIAGFKGNVVYFCEPFQPHAWPRSYRKTIENNIVAMEAYGQSLVVLTDDAPYVCTLTDPLSATFSKLGTVEPCISKRACRSLGYGVMYPSPNGLILVTARQTKNVIDDMWESAAWRALFAGKQSFALVHNERYWLTIHSGSSASTTWIFNPLEAPIMISRLDEGSYSGGGVDRDEDKMFMFGNVGGAAVIEVTPDSAANGALPARWISATFVMAFPCNMGACQVFYDYKQNTPQSLVVEFTALDALNNPHVFTKVVTSQEPFRLPSGFLAREWYISITTDVPIQEIYVAETIEELRGAAAA